MIGYIDSSFILSILFEDENYEKSIMEWNSLKYFFSSILISIETKINLFKIYSYNKFDEHWFLKKSSVLDEMLSSINQKHVDDEIVKVIQNNDVLKEIKTLDSIHLATAIIFNKYSNKTIKLFTYDNQMIQKAKKLNLKIGGG